MSMLGRLRRIALRGSSGGRRPGRRQAPGENGCHEFLAALHERFEPRTYLEIGVNSGRSLALSHVPSVAVDPAFRVTVEIETDVHLVRATSDDLFARPDPLGHLRGRIHPPAGAANGAANGTSDPVVDLAFIDGMHLFEFALRDFINVERFATPASVIVFDDMLPRSVPEAARDRVTSAWTGDVYKVVDVLRQYRPDLLVVQVDTKPTGVVVVFGADPASSVLHDRYDEILAATVRPDPQQVPDTVLTRSDAIAPATLLASGVWGTLGSARDGALASDLIREAVSGELAALPRRSVAAPA